MNKFSLALLGAVCLVGCASNPSTPSTSTAATKSSSESAQTVAKNSSEYSAPKLVCKREKPIGSKRIVKTCRTRDEWDDEARRTQSSMMGDLGGAGGCVDCGGGDGGG